MGKRIECDPRRLPLLLRVTARCVVWWSAACLTWSPSARKLAAGDPGMPAASATVCSMI